MLLDEDSQGKLLLNLLLKAGHDVETVNQSGLRTASDERVFKYAREQNRLLLTHNCDDFAELAIGLLAQGGHHNGLLLVYGTDNVSKRIGAHAIVRALGNIEKLKISLVDQVFPLNSYTY